MEPDNAMENNRIDIVISASDGPIILVFHGNECRPCVTQEALLVHAAEGPDFPV